MAQPWAEVLAGRPRRLLGPTRLAPWLPQIASTHVAHLIRPKSSIRKELLMPTLKQDTPQPPVEDLARNFLQNCTLHKGSSDAQLACQPDPERVKALTQLIYQAQQAARLDELQTLEARSDCIEDQCGLDAQLLQDNLLERIAHLEAEQKGDSEQ